MVCIIITAIHNITLVNNYNGCFTDNHNIHMHFSNLHDIMVKSCCNSLTPLFVISHLFISQSKVKEAVKDKRTHYWAMD